MVWETKSSHASGNTLYYGTEKWNARERQVQLSLIPKSWIFWIADTSRPIREDEIDGKVYHFISREQMEADIADNKYLEWGEFGGHLYGTKLDTIREIMSRDKMVILDCSPQVSNRYIGIRKRSAVASVDSRDFHSAGIKSILFY